MSEERISPGFRLNEREIAHYQRTDLLMGYGPVRSLIQIGALAGFLIGLIPGTWVILNGTIRFLTLGVKYPRFKDPPLVSFIPIIPDIMLLASFGAGLAYLRMVSLQQDRFTLIATPYGPMRLGLDDLVGLVVGTPLIWFILHRHGYGILFFIMGAQLLLFPFLGFMLASIWRSMYALLVRRLVTVPYPAELCVTVEKTLRHHADLAEMFLLHGVTFDQEEKRLTVTGTYAEKAEQKLAEQRLRDVIRHIPYVTPTVEQIAIVSIVT